jgi:hypothetical protein
MYYRPVRRGFVFIAERRFEDRTNMTPDIHLSMQQALATVIVGKLEAPSSTTCRATSMTNART